MKAGGKVIAMKRAPLDSIVGLLNVKLHQTGMSLIWSVYLDPISAQQDIIKGTPALLQKPLVED